LVAGDEQQAHAAKMKIVALFKENNVSPLRSLVPLLTQMPLFISFFLALRAMADAPVCTWTSASLFAVSRSLLSQIESMTTGGMLWFTSLCAPDPLYVLPVLASGFMMATVEV
jgi:YidC/Oxa1 family membrane protein insertase